MRYFKLPSINRQRNRKPEPDIEKLFAIHTGTAYPERGLNEKQISSNSAAQKKTPVTAAENADGDHPADRTPSIPEFPDGQLRAPVDLSGDSAGKTAAVYSDSVSRAVGKQALPGSGLPHTDTATSGLQWGENSSFVSNISKIADLSQKQLRFLRRTHDLLKTSGSEKYYS